MTITREQIEMYASAADATQTFEMDKGKLIAVEPEHMQELARMALAGMEAEPVGVTDKSEIECLMRGEMANVMPPDYKGCDLGDSVHLYTAPQPLTTSERSELENYRNAQQVVPGEQHSERFDWTYGDWAEHLGGRHQNNDPANYYEFGSFMAVAEMLRQFGNVQRKAGWNACRAAMQGKAQPGNSPVVQDDWAMVPVEPDRDIPNDMTDETLEDSRNVNVRRGLPDAVTMGSKNR